MGSPEGQCVVIRKRLSSIEKERRELYARLLHSWRSQWRDRPLTEPANGIMVSTGSLVLRRRKIGFVFQFYDLSPALNATENAASPITLDGANGAMASS